MIWGYPYLRKPPNGSGNGIYLQNGWREQNQSLGYRTLSDPYWFNVIYHDLRFTSHIYTHITYTKHHPFLWRNRSKLWMVCQMDPNGLGSSRMVTKVTSAEYPRQLGWGINIIGTSQQCDRISQTQPYSSFYTRGVTWGRPDSVDVTWLKNVIKTPWQ